MNYKYYQEVIQKLTGLTEEQKIEYLSEVIENETDLISEEVFNQTDEYINAYGTHEKYIQIMTTDSERNIYLEKLILLRENLPEKEEDEKYYMKWVSSAEKLDVLLDALPAIFEDKAEFKQALLHVDHPLNKPSWKTSQNALIYLIKNLIENGFIKLTEKSILQTLTYYFTGKKGQNFTYDSLKKAGAVKEDNAELIDDIIKKIQ